MLSTLGNFFATKIKILTILAREPTDEDRAAAIKEVKEDGPAGYGIVVWSLINTREFLFIQ